MKHKRFFLLVCLLLTGVIVLAGLTFTQKVSAQAPAPTQQPPRLQEQPGAPAKVVTDNDVNRVAKKLYCPVCPNTPLDVCETKACKDWRAQIREQLSAGWTDQQAIDYFVQQYGERVLAEPERGGFTSLVWTLPVLVFGLGLILVWLILKSWRSGKKSRPAAPQPVPSSPSVSPDVLAKIEAELRQMD